jgi:hypothetical protein
VGVKRQYAGCLGRTDNCQVGVFVNYATAAGHTLIDRRLFVPEEWIADKPRRHEAGVPTNVVFRTKPELALEMVQAALVPGVATATVGKKKNGNSVSPRSARYWCTCSTDDAGATPKSSPGRDGGKRVIASPRHATPAVAAPNTSSGEGRKKGRCSIRITA